MKDFSRMLANCKEQLDIVRNIVLLLFQTYRLDIKRISNLRDAAILFVYDTLLPLTTQGLINLANWPFLQYVTNLYELFHLDKTEFESDFIFWEINSRFCVCFNIDNVSKQSDMSTRGLLFQGASTMTIQLSMLVQYKADVIISLEIKLFQLQYICKIAKLALNTNHSNTCDMQALNVIRKSNLINKYDYLNILNLAVVWDFLTLMDKYNICIMS